MLRDCLPEHVIQGKIEVTGRRGRRLKQLVGDLKENGRYWGLKAAGFDHTVWKCRFGSGFGPVVRRCYDYDDGDN